MIWAALLGVCTGDALAWQTASVVSAISIPLILPEAVAFDAAGNLYIAERGANLIRRVDGAGIITVFAGNGVQGFSGDGGLASSASLDSPRGLAVGPGNTLYIADTHNCRIRSVDLSTRLISTFAGTGACGGSGDGGPATQAELDRPTALATGTDGALYVADTGDHRIRKVSTSGTISTVAGSTQGLSGDGRPAGEAALDSPQGLAVDAAGNIYISDTHNHELRRVDSGTGLISTIAGGGNGGFAGDGGAAVSSQLALPRGVSLSPTGEIYFSDSANQRVRRIGTDGVITTLAGNGTQGSSGSGGASTSASLNSPSGLVVSSAGLPAFADTGNQRVGEITSQQADQTVAGLGATLPGTLLLSAPSVVSYGSGNVIASLKTATQATGAVTFLSVSASSSTTLASSTLSSGMASLSTAMLPAGAYSIVATYGGDSDHAAAQSAILALTVSPLQVSAVPDGVHLLYGQAVPALTGTLNGILPRDQQNVSVQFLSGAQNLSNAGLYPISASLSGSAAADYVADVASASVVISKAPSVATLALSGTSSPAGTPVSLSAQVVSTTAGSPTGTLTFLDGSQVLATEPIAASGNATFTSTGFPAGAHVLSAAYSGDGNFLPSASAAASLLVGGVTGSGTGVDFTLASTGSTNQTVAGGGAVVYAFTTQVQGALSSPITLAAMGLPLGATASFSPAYLPPGGPGTFTLTITTAKAALTRAGVSSRERSLLSLSLLLLPWPLSWASFKRSGRRSGLISLTLVPITLGLLLLAGCGDRIFTASQASSSKSYTITVNASATSPSGISLLHSATVSLTVQ